MTFKFAGEEALTPVEKVLRSLSQQVELTAQERISVQNEIQRSFDRGYGFSFDVHTRNMYQNEAVPADAVFVFHQTVLRKQLGILNGT